MTYASGLLFESKWNETKNCNVKNWKTRYDCIWSIQTCSHEKHPSF